MANKLIHVHMRALLSLVLMILPATGVLAGESDEWTMKPWNPLYAQTRARIEKHPDKAMDVMLEVAKNMAEAWDDPKRFGRAFFEFSDGMRALESGTIRISQDSARPVSEILIDLYTRTAQQYPDRGPWIAEFVAKYGGDNRAKEFVLAAIEGKTKATGNLQIHAIAALSFTQAFAGDDDIFEALKTHFKSDNKKFDALAALSRLDPEHADDFLRIQISSAADPYTLNKIAGIISAIHRPPLVKALLLRAEEIGKREASFEGDPTYGIYDSALAEYLMWAQGSDFELGLPLLGRIPKVRARPILAEKLKSPEPTTRIAILRAYSQRWGQGQPDPEGIQMIYEHLQRETDSEVKKVAVEALARAKPNPHQ